MKRCFITLFIIINTLCTHAQTIGLGTSFNYLTSGVNVEYGKKINKKYSYQTGFKFIINTNQYYPNKQSNIYYQNGYAKHFYERFALNFRINRNLFAYKKFNFILFSNMYLSWHSLLEKGFVYSLNYYMMVYYIIIENQRSRQK